MVVSIAHMYYTAIVNQAVEIFKAIGEETRLRILRILIKADEELCVCEIVDILGKPQYTTSRSLTTLKKAELVEERRQGKLMMYRLKRSALNNMLFKSVAALPEDDKSYKGDFAALDHRLAIREEGKCVVTYHGRKYWRKKHG